MAAGNMYQSSRDRRRGGEEEHQQQQADTRYTKVFVGGLAWETQRDAMRSHFEQYGEIVEAVVITDKATGRSKGYGFVTFRDPEAARRACADPTPIIDGRRANCNLASLGAQHRGSSRPPFSFVRGNHFRAMAPAPVNLQTGGGGPLYPMYFQQGNYAFQYGPPYQGYVYPYSPELVYQPGMYNPYGGLQYAPQVFSGAPGGSSATYAAYVQPSSQGFPMQLPQMMQYGAAQQPYGFVPLSPSVTSTGATVGYSSPSTTGSPRLSPPPQFFTVQNPHFSQTPKSEEQ